MLQPFCPCKIFERGESYRAFEIKSIADLAHRWHGVAAVYRRISTTIVQCAKKSIPVLLFGTKEQIAIANSSSWKFIFPAILSIECEWKTKKARLSFIFYPPNHPNSFSYIPNSQLLPLHSLSVSLHSLRASNRASSFGKDERERERERGANLLEQIFRRSPIIYDRESSIIR